MAYQEELERLVGAKSSMRQSIINKGIEIPEETKIQDYPKYIKRIGLTPPTGNGTLADLKTALPYGNATELYPVGTEIPDTYDGHDNPLIVAQYLDASNNESYGGAEGVILVRKYVEPIAQIYSPNGQESNYIGSTIQAFLDEDYLAKSSDGLKSVISSITIPYFRDEQTNGVQSKWFLMSETEVGGYHNSVEGIFWDYWKQKTSLASANNSANSGRVVTDRSGAATACWLRTSTATAPPYTSASDITKTGSVYHLNSCWVQNGVLPACFISSSTSTQSEDDGTDWGTLYTTAYPDGLVLQSEADYQALGSYTTPNIAVSIAGKSIIGKTVTGFSFGKKCVYCPNTFLAYCSSLVRPMTIPGYVETIGPQFMRECRNFTGLLTINTTISPPSSALFTAYGTSDPSYSQGIRITGLGAQIWKNALPDQSNYGAHQHRKLILA